MEPAACQIRLGGQQKKGVRKFKKLEKTSLGPSVLPAYDSRRKMRRTFNAFRTVLRRLRTKVRQPKDGGLFKGISTGNTTPGKRFTADVSKVYQVQRCVRLYPVTVFVRKLVRAHDPLRRSQNHFRRNVGTIHRLSIFVDL